MAFDDDKVIFFYLGKLMCSLPIGDIVFPLFVVVSFKIIWRRYLSILVCVCVCTSGHVGICLCVC